MLEEAYNSIVSAGAVAVILTAGLILVYRHLNADRKDLRAELDKREAQYKADLKAKDDQIKELIEELKDITKENITLETRILDVLKTMNHGR